MKTIKSAAKIREERLFNLINACFEKYSEEEMIEMFNDITGKEYVENTDYEERISDLVMKGYCIFKPESNAQGEKLREYAETNIFPYYNEQQTAILF